MTEQKVTRWRWKSDGQTGLIHANGQLHAIRLLSERGLSRISVQREHLIKTPKPADKEWLQTIEQWLELLECGLPLPDALKHSVNQHSSKAMTWLVNDCLATIKLGRPLSSALKQYSDWLPAADIQTIEWAESSGHLVSGLHNILTLKQQQIALKGTTHQSTSLPAYYCGICLCRCFTHDDLGTSPVSEAFWECQLTAVDSKGYRNFRIRKPTRCVYRWRFLPNLPFLPAD